MRGKPIALIGCVVCLGLTQGFVGIATEGLADKSAALSLLSTYSPQDSYPALRLLYPLDGTVFPPEIVPPLFLWHDQGDGIDSWGLLLRCGEWSWGPQIVDGVLPDPILDEACVTKNNGYQRAADLRGWKPQAALWEELKRMSVHQPAVLTVLGIRSADPAGIVCRGTVRITTSPDPVGAPVFYRDVPLMPSAGEDGIISPLPADAIPLVKLRLREISQPVAKIVAENPPTCVNCHSFSSDGKTIGMDMDGPDGDKGAYALADLRPRLSLTKTDLISWNAFPEKPPGHQTVGLFSAVSPTGRFVVSTVNEFIFVANYPDFQFLQTFYPTRGILAIYSREKGAMKPLPGADDRAYVHTNAAWSPDEKFLVFSRARAMPAGVDLQRPTRANDPREYPVQYDLYRMPFNGGRGGRAEAVRGASGNGHSNSFPKVSPDGRWIAFVQARNGQLMRPDSRLWIVPFEGGSARELSCNTPQMNSWHSWSPNGRWLVFSSKWLTPFTQMFLTHIDENGNSTPPVLIPDSTAANRAVNIPEFVNIEAGQLDRIEAPAMDHMRYTRQANKLRREGRTEEAITAYRKALGVKPDFPPALYNLGVLFLKQNRIPEARDQFIRTLQLEPSHAMAMCNLGSVEFRTGDAARAEKLFQDALRLAPKSAQVHFNLASLASRRQDWRTADSHYRKAIFLHQELRLEDLELLAACHDGLGNVLLLQGNTEGAEEQYRRVAAISPSHPAAYYNLGQIHLQRGSLDSALLSFRTALKLAPNDPDIHYRLGEVLEKKRAFRDAMEHYDKARSLTEKAGNATLRLIWLLAACPDDRIRDGARAVQLGERVARLTDGRNPAVLDALSLAYAEAGRFEDAFRTASTALALAEKGREPILAWEIRRRLRSFQEKRPWRQNDQ